MTGAPEGWYRDSYGLHRKHDLSGGPHDDDQPVLFPDLSGGPHDDPPVLFPDPPELTPVVDMDTDTDAVYDAVSDAVMALASGQASEGVPVTGIGVAGVAAGEPVALIVAAPPRPVPVAGKATRLTFTLTTALPLDQALERRDDVIALLRAAGIRLSMTQGTDIALADVGVPTLGDAFTGRA